MTVADLRKSSGMGSEQDIENHPLLELSEVGSPNAGRVRRAAGAGTVALAVIASAYALHVSLRARAPATTNDTTIAAYTQGVTTSGGFITLGADSSMCLDVQGGQNNVYTYPCVPGNHNQQFSLFRPSETSTAFKVQWMSNTQSEQCLGNVNGNLGISPCDAAAELKVPTSGNGPVQLGGQCLKVEGVTPGADLATKNVAWGDCAQAMPFSFTQVPTYMPGTLPSLADATQCLVAVGTTVQMGACTSPSANWIYNRDGNPGVIRSATDKTKCITFVQPSSTFELMPCLIQGGADNLWIAQPTGALTLAGSGTCLTPGASTTCVGFQLPVTPTLSPAAPAPAPVTIPAATPQPGATTPQPGATGATTPQPGATTPQLVATTPQPGATGATTPQPGATTPQPGAATPQPGALSSEMQAVLDKHNVYRCMHGVPDFTWDADIAANAQSWAAQGNYAHMPSDQRIINGEQVGENIAWGSPTLSGDLATFRWYSEITSTNPNGIVNEFASATGHYTQVVWQSSTKLGCGKGQADGGDFWVCQYGPGGNMGGQFSSNVLAPTATAESCGGSATDVP